MNLLDFFIKKIIKQSCLNKDIALPSLYDHVTLMSGKAEIVEEKLINIQSPTSGPLSTRIMRYIPK